MMLETGWPALVLILVGELVDRGELYEEMEVPTPNSLLFDELEDAAGGSRQGIKNRPGPEIPKRKGDRDRHQLNRVEIWLSSNNTKIVGFSDAMASKRFPVFKYFLPRRGYCLERPCNFNAQEALR